MDLDTRIKQFEELVAEDPSNDMAHFSLAGAYMQAERLQDAVEAYRRCTEANAEMSKAYQLGAQALIKLDKSDEAADMLMRGYVIAAERGDVMPKQAMADLLRQLGRDVPEVKSKAEQDAPPGSFVCRKTGKAGHQLPRPPFKTDMGTWIHENISKETFDEWIGLGTKIINELKLDLSNDEHDVVYEYGMRRFLGITPEVAESFENDTYPKPQGEFRDVIDQILGRMGDLEAFGGQLDQKVGG
ncbi:MAG: Fe(2+)-trafficking protein [Planctomycetota bacterium]